MKDLFTWEVVDSRVKLKKDELSLVIVYGWANVLSATAGFSHKANLPEICYIPAKSHK